MASTAGAAAGAGLNAARARKSRTPPTQEMREERQRERSARRVIRERGEVTKGVEVFRTQQIGERQAQSASEYAARRREDLLTARKVRGEVRSERRREAIVSSATAPVKEGVNVILLILFVIVGLVIFYALSTNPGPTTSFFGSLTAFMRTLSTNASLFERVPTTSSTSGSTTTTPTASTQTPATSSPTPIHA